MEEYWIFTFGSNHKDTAGNSLGKKYVKIEGTATSSRAKMHEARGSIWAWQYATKNAAGVIDYNLKEIQLEDVNINGD